MKNNRIIATALFIPLKTGKLFIEIDFVLKRGYLCRNH
jgi:hypothetical protein